MNFLFVKFIQKVVTANDGPLKLNGNYPVTPKLRIYLGDEKFSRATNLLPVRFYFRPGYAVTKHDTSCGCLDPTSGVRHIRSNFDKLLSVANDLTERNLGPYHYAYLVSSALISSIKDRMERSRSMIASTISSGLR